MSILLVIGDVLGREFGRTGRWVLDIVSSASHSVERQQGFAHGWVELGANRVVHRQMSSAAGGAQALIFQDGRQRLPCRVVQQGVGAFGVRGYRILS